LGFKIVDVSQKLNIKYFNESGNLYNGFPIKIRQAYLRLFSDRINKVLQDKVISALQKSCKSPYTFCVCGDLKLASQKKPFIIKEMEDIFCFFKF